MCKRVVFLFLIIIQTVNSQNQLWKGYFSYNEVKDLAVSDIKIFAACENSLFYKNRITSDITTVNTINGLSGQTISAIYHSEIYKKTFIGYENGLLYILNDVTGEIQILVGIRDQSGGIPPNQKRINNFYEHLDKIYISTDFGIVEFKLVDLSFGDTFYISATGGFTQVVEITVFQNYLYAVTKNNGIRRVNLANQNLINFMLWETFDSNFWNGIVTFNNELVALNANNKIYKNNGSGFVEVFSLNQQGLDIRAVLNQLVLTTNNNVYILNNLYNQNLVVNAATLQNFNSAFTAATIINQTLYIGTKTKGMLELAIGNPQNVTALLPNGPELNNIFSIQTTSSGNLWAVYGDYTQFNNPYPLDSYGISKMIDGVWTYIPYENLLDAKSIVRITVKPGNEDEVYASSYFSGLLKITNNQISIFNTSNSTLESLVIPGNPTYGPDIRVEQTVFDKAGNLWVSNGLIANMIKVLRSNGQWQSYSLDAVLTGLTANSRMSIDKNGTKWLCTLDMGVIGFNENYNNKKIKITDGESNGNLPSAAVQVAAVDNRNQLWIGTRRGLRVLPSVDRFISEDELTANAIIILEDGLPQELLYSQFITDIVVDGANNKWIGTADSGVFLLSPNGQETLERFTISNSPLPSNTINDIDIDGNTGEVFISTLKGMVSFKGNATKSKETLSNVYVYPNPVRPEYTGTIKITELTNKANIKITDIEGSLVYETTSEGGTIEWDTTAFGKYKVASGVYMIFISTEDGLETTVKKVMIVR